MGCEGWVTAEGVYCMYGIKSKGLPSISSLHIQVRERPDMNGFEEGNWRSFLDQTDNIHTHGRPELG